MSAVFVANLKELSQKLDALADILGLVSEQIKALESRVLELESANPETYAEHNRSHRRAGKAS